MSEMPSGVNDGSSGESITEGEEGGQMAYKFNRGCRVESWEESLFPGEEPKAGKGEETACARKVHQARWLFQTWGEQLLQESQVHSLLAELKSALEASRQAMLDLGVMAACARCDATAPEGSCCSRGLENKFDPVLLLVNQLMGVRFDTLLQQQSSSGRSCVFLLPNGCGLEVRHPICIDYYCPELQAALGRDGLIRLQSVAGREIETIFRLCDVTKRLLVAYRQEAEDQ